MKTNNIFSDIIKPALVLAVVSLVVSSALVIVYNITKKPEGVLDEKVITAAKTVLNSDVEQVNLDLNKYSEYNLKAVIKAKDSDNVAVCLTTKGYGGDIFTVVGIDSEGKVINVQITDMKETAGLGDKTMQPEFLKQYIGKESGITVIKSGASGNQIDAISGATISSKAVTTGVNNSLEIYKAIKGEVSGK